MCRSKARKTVGGPMAKQTWRGGNMLYPLPVVMVSCANAAGESDIITVAWTGTACTNPPMLYVSLRPERHSYHIIRESGEFVVNLVGTRLARACDWCGVRSGREHDKWAECGLTKAKASVLELAPAIAEAPVSIECKVSKVLELGSHHMFLATVEAVQVDEALLDDAGKLDLDRARLITYSHGEYRELGQLLGTFGHSVRKARPGAKSAKTQTRGAGTAAARAQAKGARGEGRGTKGAGGTGRPRPGKGAGDNKRPGAPRRPNGRGRRA